MRSNWRGCLLEILETVVLTLLIYLVVQTFVAQPFQIYQDSMENTLDPGQMVLVDKLSPHFIDYKRGDVIVFEPPAGAREDGTDVPFIKRVIGVGGDTVQIKDGAVWVNGAKLNEPYVYDGQATDPTTGQSVWTVPSGYLFVLGDHRQESQDSRVFGPIPESSVIGRAWLRYWGGPFGFVGSASYDNVPNPSPAVSP
ncbi:MAG: signal peptidase I [Candidatus Limnocylindrales bacterium]|jgi:signal peptidase I